jgi:hypothetical protein
MRTAPNGVLIMLIMLANFYAIHPHSIMVSVSKCYIKLTVHTN